MLFREDSSELKRYNTRAGLAPQLLTVRVRDIGNSRKGIFLHMNAYWNVLLHEMKDFTGTLQLN